jgi:hypothetical protein
MHNPNEIYNIMLGCLNYLFVPDQGGLLVEYP